MQGYTVFVTYLIECEVYNENGVFGYSTPIHCNYINKIELNSLNNKTINLYFNNIDDLSNMYSGGTEWYGWTANRFNILVQIVNNSNYQNVDEIKPLSNMWRVYDVTNQINFNNYITPNNIVGMAFNVDLGQYEHKNIYDLSYINYPSNQQTNYLSFGDEIYFFGNVKTEIQAIGYTTDISLNLQNNEYNYTTNQTWDGNQDILITEVGIYSKDGELVAIGKLNYPISKNSNINRNISFKIDF